MTEKKTAEEVREILTRLVLADDLSTTWKIKCHKSTTKIMEIMKAYAAQQSKIPTEDVAIRNFFIWMVRKANIDVIDAENAIEVHSLREPSTGLVPVVSIDELIKMYRNQITG